MTVPFDPSAPPTILLVSPDLLATSRLATAARDIPARLVTIRSLVPQDERGHPDIAAAHLVLLDLGGFAEDPATVVVALRRLLGADHAAPVVAFGPHVARARRAEAVAAGADEAVSRGELLGAFSALARRWLRRDAG
jgi:hypothetical protein